MFPGNTLGIKSSDAPDMWQSVLNQLNSLLTYQDLSPDRALRRRVNARLRDRPNLPFELWSSTFLADLDEPLAPALLFFIYTYLPIYSGLEVGRTRSDDRLIEDLHLPLVCWFDWPHQLCDDFYCTFQVDISEDFDESLLETVADLVQFLQEHLRSMDSLPAG
jgi:hypothetical protein